MTERVWDKFLSEQDKLHLQRNRRGEPSFGQRPALLMIDLYRWVFGDRPQPLLEAIKEWPGSCGMAAWEALPHIQDLLNTAREVGIPVIHMTGLYPEESGVQSWSNGPRSAPRSSYMGGTGATDDKRSRMYEIIDELKPIPGEAFLRKASPSAFFGTPLVAHLTSLGVDTIIVAGESTSGCVRASVVDGCTYRYRMIVAEECVFDRHEASHAINLFDMHQKYADVLPVKEVIDWMRAWRAPEGFATAGAVTAGR